MEYEGIIYRYKSPSGKYYIGQTINEERRRRCFLYDEMYGGVKIDRARKKYGPKNFEYTVLVKITGDNPEEIKKYLNTLEIGFIKMYNSIENGYNIAAGGEGCAGYHPTEETRRKMGDIHRGKEPWNKGKSMTEDQKKKMRGRTFSEEHRRKLSEAKRGKTLPDEQKKKMSEAHKGVVFSDEHRQKLSEKAKESRKGKHRVYSPDGSFHYE